MKISIPVNHNFYEEAPIRETALVDAFNLKKSGDKRRLQDLFTSVYELKLGDKQLKHVRIFNFKRRNFFKFDEERLILRLYSKKKSDQESEYYIQTGLYAGVLFYRGCKINITSKYGDIFLRRMLNFVNDIYVDTEHVKATRDETENQFLFIIAYLFIQSLEKAAVLGLPQEYKKQKERNSKVRGSIDFPEYLKRDIPFQGKLTSNFRERLYVQEIVDVLYLALRKLEKLFGKEIHGRLLGLNQLLKQNYSGLYVNQESLTKAKTSPSINNAMYSGYKSVLEYAGIILLNKDLIPDSEEQYTATTGFLFDIAELYELYLEKLLIKNFPDWSVTGQSEIPLYQHQFYGRSMFPDLVMKHKILGKIVVFDAKFKKMDFLNSDIDRTDLHQVHSYSGFYRDNLVASGLIYPLSKEIEIKKAHSGSLYGNEENKTKFIVDGIYVDENDSIRELVKNEEAFINRISAVINN